MSHSLQPAPLGKGGAGLMDKPSPKTSPEPKPPPPPQPPPREPIGKGLVKK